MGTESTRQHAVFLYKCNNEIEQQQQQKKVTIRITGTSWKESAVPSWWIKFWAHTQKQKKKTTKKSILRNYTVCNIRLKKLLMRFMHYVKSPSEASLKHTGAVDKNITAYTNFSILLPFCHAVAKWQEPVVLKVTAAGTARTQGH